MEILHTCSEPATGNEKSAAVITDKKGYSERWKFSLRKIDSLLAHGLPHLKIGQRRVRINIAEADAWMHQQFSQQRRNTPTQEGQNN